MYSTPRITASVLEFDAADSPTRIVFLIDSHCVSHVFPVADRVSEMDIERVAERITRTIPFDVSLDQARQGVTRLLATHGVQP